MGGRAVLLLVISALFAQIGASDPVIDLSVSVPPHPVLSVCLILGEICDVLRVVLQLFHESFNESFDGSWIVSGKEEYKGNSLAFPLRVIRSVRRSSRGFSGRLGF